MKKRRLFIAIDSPEVKEKISDYLTSRVWPDNFRFVGKGNLHLTILFLGATPEEQIPAVAEAIKKVAQNSSPFSVELNTIDYGPNPQRPRLIWFYGPYHPLLDQLKLNLEEELERRAIYFSREARRLLPHLTLFRLKTDKTNRFPPLENNLKINFEASALKLMESHLEKNGAYYETLAEYPLSAQK